MRTRVPPSTAMSEALAADEARASWRELPKDSCSVVYGGAYSKLSEAVPVVQRKGPSNSTAKAALAVTRLPRQGGRRMPRRCCRHGLWNCLRRGAERRIVAHA